MDWIDVGVSFFVTVLLVAGIGQIFNVLWNNLVIPYQGNQWDGIGGIIFLLFFGIPTFVIIGAIIGWFRNRKNKQLY